MCRYVLIPRTLQVELKNVNCLKKSAGEFALAAVLQKWVSTHPSSWEVAIVRAYLSHT